MRIAVELRKTKRYRLSAPAIFLWSSHNGNHNGKPQGGKGVTRDINTFGVYVLTDTLPPVGALVQMEIVLPKLTDPGSGMHLYGEGVVLRGEPRGSQDVGSSQGGFACSVQFYPETTASVLSHLENSGRAL
jgi:predicted heme/steroid binding protein